MARAGVDCIQISNRCDPWNGSPSNLTGQLVENLACWNNPRIGRQTIQQSTIKLSCHRVRFCCAPRGIPDGSEIAPRSTRPDLVNVDLFGLAGQSAKIGDPGLRGIQYVEVGLQRQHVEMSRRQLVAKRPERWQRDFGGQALTPDLSQPGSILHVLSGLISVAARTCPGGEHTFWQFTGERVTNVIGGNRFCRRRIARTQDSGYDSQHKHEVDSSHVIKLITPLRRRQGKSLTPRKCRDPTWKGRGAVKLDYVMRLGDLNHRTR